METMRRRGVNGGLCLASADETQRRECVAFYRHLLEPSTTALRPQAR